MSYTDDAQHAHKVWNVGEDARELARILKALQVCVASPTSPRWVDAKFPATGINPPGAVSDPARNTTTGLLEFSKTAINVVAGVFQLNHDWKQGSLISPHIHVHYPTAPVADTGDTVVWRFSYVMLPIGASWDGLTYTDSGDVEHVLAAGDEDTHLLFELGDFDMADYIDSGVSMCIMWRVSRVGNAAADNYDDIATLIELDVHHQLDGQGSREEYVK